MMIMMLFLDLFCSDLILLLTKCNCLYRRLRDMLLENEEVISFTPGHRKNGRVVLGRIVVHDRLAVESTVLPRYFNHSSFASLRRQLNYFSFVRLGKGRQRESTYINEGVVELDDLLHLKRRSAGSSSPPADVVMTKEQDFPEETSSTYVDAVVPVVHLPVSLRKKERTVKNRTRRGRKTTVITNPPSSVSQMNNFVSEDECSEGKSHIALDLTLPPNADEEMLAGCSALLHLSGKGWD